MKSNPPIRLYATENRYGVAIPIDIYEAIKKAIVSLISNSPQKKLPLDVLLDSVSAAVSSTRTIEPWLILQVKIDLHERGVISHYFNRDRMQVIELVRRRARRKQNI